MIHINNASLSFSDTVILDNASMQVSIGQKVGICAPNGTGKTTLLNSIAGRQEINTGKISVAPKTTIAYFEQQGINLGDHTVKEEFESAFASYETIKEEISLHERSLETCASDLKKMQGILDTLDILHAKLNAINYDRREAEMQRVLRGLGFMPEDLYRIGNEFSGGWQMKIGLAKVLLSKPDLLLLDEPTNHLDLESRMWLMESIRNFKGTLLLISHDRYFLDHTIDHIVELEQGVLSLYTGNYSAYELTLKNNASRQQQYQKQYTEERARQEAFIEKFRYKATKARQVQSRIKALEKIPEPVELYNNAEIKLHFPLSRPSGEHVLEAVNISKSYDGISVLKDLNFSITRGEKIGLLGPNGVGKSTLVRILAGQDLDYEGELLWGAHMHIAYFSQRAADLLDENKTIWDYIMDIESSQNDLARRSLLGAFLFSDETIFKRIGMLSGGEKARVLLASLALVPCNFLVLDEPSNHLDLDTQRILLDALREFKGSILFTTHDRYLLEHLADKIFVLEDKDSYSEENATRANTISKPKGGDRNYIPPQSSTQNTTVTAKHRSQTKQAKFSVYWGDYEYYLWKKQKATASMQASSSRDVSSALAPKHARRATPNPSLGQQHDALATSHDDTKNASQGAVDYQLQKQENARIRKLEKEEENLLKKIDLTTHALDVARNKFSQEDIYSDSIKIIEVNKEIAKTEKDLEDLHVQWQTLHDQY